MPSYDVISLQYGKEYDKAAGEGTLTLLYDTKLFNVLAKYAEIEIAVGWQTPFDNNVQPVVSGFIKDIKPTKNQIDVNFTDKGILLDSTGSVDFTQKKRSYIIAAIIKQAGLKPVVDLGDSKDDVIDYSGGETSTQTDETGQTATSDTNAGTDTNKSVSTDASATASSGTVTGIGCCSAADCVGKYGSMKYYQTTVLNKCPGCHAEGTLVYIINCAANKCGNDDNPMVEGHYICCSKKTATKAGTAGNKGCDRDFDVVNGSNHGNNNEKLTIVSGPTPAAKPSGSNCGDTSLSGGGSAAKANTYWEMLVQLCDPTDHDLQIVVFGDVCYVTQVPDASNAQILIDSRQNVIEDSVKITEGNPLVTNNIIVNYGQGIRTNNIKVQNDRLVSKYGLSPTKKYNKPKYDYNKAVAFAHKELARLERDDGFQIELDMLGQPYIWYGMWAKTTMPKYGISDEYYITKFSLETDVDKPLQDSVTLTEYRPTLQLASSGTTVSGGTLDSIGQKAATFKYGGNCGTGDCIEKAGHGDCFNMSDWLYDKLTAAGIKCKIIEYDSPYASSGRHRTVQLYQNNQWVDFPYQQYKINYMFEPLTNKRNLENYRGG